MKNAMNRWMRIFLGIIIIMVIIISISLARRGPRIEDGKYMEEEQHSSIHIDGGQDEEGLIMKIIASENSEKYLQDVLDIFPNLDLDRLEDIHGEGSVLKVLEWLATQRIQGEDNIIRLIGMIDEFYRDEYFKFAEIIANSYRLDKLEFIRALAKVPNKVNTVAYAMYDARAYGRLGAGNLSDDLELIIASDELTKEDKDIGIRLLNTYLECGT